MFRIFAAIVILGLLGAVFTLRLMFAVGAALFAALAAGLLGAALGESPFLAALIAGLVTFVAMRWRERARRRARSRRQRNAAPATVPPAGPQSRPLVAPQLQARLAALQQALDGARSAGSIDPALVEWAPVIERRVPELIAATAEVHRVAPPAERPALVAALAGDLEAIASEGERRLAAAGGDARERLATLRRYVATRTGTIPPSDPVL